ncbi:type I-E CRISPR-associated protein Cas7/Cse4/CasC [Streptantibioticus silvisoli]|uniref:Type I-E CRISPR-associated protein Cas7/Cse4/CasC n=1 Tax=Streptantibioticus silvisoli TaxID=2705255 RepID=A0ABT6W2E7_9ACTN|nr:type I-E CRISPR-associated protein Cas7/Cse4/CasC [Streptantibioticus silvisoli]MDI5964919.1 type I-E CRISPR-associated protein Cas7/Cse4/CasC [Streptantibioticus silvisoli]
MAPRLYIDVHILQTVPPANLNRDDQGNPKEAYFGGVRRSRVSSQAWKRATRKAFAEQVPEADLAVRTKKIASRLATGIGKRTGLDEEAAARLAGALLAPLGIKAGRKAGDTAYLLFYGRRQLETVVDLVADRAAELTALTDDDLAEQIKNLDVAGAFGTGHPMDVALFGRMVADIPTLNVDAATQVAHALSTHATELEFDYYTAVDDENEKEETGAGMIGTIGFNSATLYRYAAVGLHQLTDNLGGDTDAALAAVELFVDTFARSMPTGHANSFAHRTRPSLVAVVVREDQPVNLVSAFERPVPPTAGLATESADRLAREYGDAVRAWGDTPLYKAACHTFGESEQTTSLTKAFGVGVTFSNLLTGLRAELAAAVERDQR